VRLPQSPRPAPAATEGLSKRVAKRGRRASAAMVAGERASGSFSFTTPLRKCLFTPELQQQSRGNMAYLTGVWTGNARG
jgi:hypothetical protein